MTAHFRVRVRQAAEAQLAAGDTAPAYCSFQQALAIDPNDRQAKGALDKLGVRNRDVDLSQGQTTITEFPSSLFQHLAPLSHALPLPDLREREELGDHAQGARSKP